MIFFLLLRDARANVEDWVNSLVQVLLNIYRLRNSVFHISAIPKERAEGIRAHAILQELSACERSFCWWGEWGRTRERRLKKGDKEKRLFPTFPCFSPLPYLYIVVFII